MNGQSRLEYLLTWLAGGLAAVVMLALPVAYFVSAYQHFSGELDGEVGVTATAVTDFINHNTELWKFDSERLQAVLRKYVNPSHGSAVIDASGEPVARLMPDLAAPVLTASWPIYDFGVEAGKLEITVSLRRLVVETAVIALGGAILGFIVFFPLRILPIRALRQATAALVDSENSYRQLVELSPDAIYINMDGKIAYINTAGLRLFGADSPDELVGRSFWERIHPDYYYMVWERWQNLVDNRASAVPLMEERYLKLDGTVFPVEVAASPCIYQGRAAVQVVVHDLTERKRVETALAQARDAAETANRSKSRFLANMSHEIRTPMNGVLGMAQLLAEQTHLTDQQRHYLDVLKDSGETLLHLIDEILDFSKIEAGKFVFSETVFDLRQRVTDTLRMLVPQARRKHLELTWNVAADVPARVRGDPSRLHQVLANLANNAIKFTQHGSIRVNVTLDERAIRDEAAMRVLYFAVRDTGVGIPEEARARLFQPFTQADDSTTRKYGGTGLGLVICKQIVEMMGGEIGYESVPDRGTTFWFTVCLAAVSDAVEPASLRPIETRELTGRVLLAEDNPVNALVAEEILKALGLEVKLAADGRDALRAWSEGRFDVVLMDCQMPEMDGFEATRQIRARELGDSDRGGAGPIPIIALTANAFSEDRERCLATGMNDYLSKPFSRDALYQTLRRWIPDRA